jgi:hypothetical protein
MQISHPKTYLFYLMIWLLFYYCLLLRELFSYSVVWWDIVPEPRQHYCKTIPKGEDNNVFSTQHLILDIENNKLKFNII